ncbi:hypothetical protein LDENG_00144370 [Lucifuga dentata]|nr:hypothetical protein LDENG_00144370 [Lucifuga dentata]
MWETGSSASRRSGNSGTRRYRTRALTSQVDETLFGKPKPNETLVQSDRDGKKRSKAKDQCQKSQQGEHVQIISKDLIREIMIPRTDPSGQSVILPSAEIKRISSASRFLTKKEKEAMEEAYRGKKREEASKASEERKRQLHEVDLLQKGNLALTELEIEARNHAQHLQKQANIMRMEQEEEIKMLNKLILSAHCHAGCDTQILEKKQIQETWTEEEKRLDDMMEVDRHKALETQKKIDDLRKEQRISGMQQILNQIQQRKEEREVQVELKEQEGRQLLQEHERLIAEDLKALERKKEEQRLLLEEIMQINAETLQTKEQRKEEERQADLRAMEFTRNKMEQEAAYEAEQRRKKREKEKEIERLRALQERDRDYKAEMDAVRARRNQEKTEREWRIKQKEQAQKKAQEDAILKAARLEQINYREHMLSIEAGREKAEFERLLKVQQETIAKEKEEEERKHQKLFRHAEAIRQQVREHELKAITQRKEVFKEGEQLNEEVQRRRILIKEFKEKKLRELKATGLSEKYCKEVERKAHTCVS